MTTKIAKKKHPVDQAFKVIIFHTKLWKSVENPNNVIFQKVIMFDFRLFLIASQIWNFKRQRPKTKN